MVANVELKEQDFPLVANDGKKLRDERRRRVKINPVNTDPNITRVCTTCSRKFPATVEYFHNQKRGMHKQQMPLTE